MVLQTLRSRCVELKLRPAGEAGDAPPESGRELCRLLAEGKRGSVTELMVRLEKKRTDRDALSLGKLRTEHRGDRFQQYRSRRGGNRS